MYKVFRCTFESTVIPRCPGLAFSQIFDISDRFRPPQIERLNASTPVSRILVKPDKKLPPEVSALPGITVYSLASDVLASQNYLGVAAPSHRAVSQLGPSNSYQTGVTQRTVLVRPQIETYGKQQYTVFGNYSTKSGLYNRNEQH